MKSENKNICEKINMGNSKSGMKTQSVESIKIE